MKINPMRHKEIISREYQKKIKWSIKEVNVAEEMSFSALLNMLGLLVSSIDNLQCARIHTRALQLCYLFHIPSYSSLL